MKKRIRWYILLGFLLMLSGCANSRVTSVSSQPQVKSVSNVVSENQLADSLDRAVIQNIDEKKHTITFFNLIKGKSYTLGYDSATGIKDRFDSELVAAQLEAGDVCMVSFLKDSRQVKNIWLEKKVTKQEQVTQFEINRTALWLDVGDTRYAISDQAVVLKDGKTYSLMDINEADTLTLYMEDRTILSFVITNEHGYVRLQGTESFVGGFVEFGQSIIKRVEEEMLVVLPSGKYDMFISSDSQPGGTKQIEVNPGEETLVDVSDLAIEEEEKEGSIIFTITPSQALLQIDGQETDYSTPVTLSYGVHQMVVSLEGYQTITEYIKVGQDLANINIEMEKAKNNSDNNKNDSSVSGNSAAATVKDGYQVYVDAPVGAELYVEGKYIGIIPTSFGKKAGSYVLSVRRSGYTTRSYSLELDDSDKDVHYSFSELEVSE